MPRPTFLFALATSLLGVQAPSAVAAIVISSVTAIPIGPYSATVTGSGFAPGLQITVGGRPTKTVYISPTQATIWGTGLPAWDGRPQRVVATVGTSVSPPILKLVGTLNPQLTWSEASRFLEHASFGPKPSQVAKVQAMGRAAWLREQFNTAPILPLYQNADIAQMARTFFGRAIASEPDQLRSRVAFALSQFFVVSTAKIGSEKMEGYQEMLYKDAFGVFFGADRRSGLLYDVTLSPGMGYYLDMSGNAAKTATSSPNENYARELLQLFSIGTVMLNPNGTPQSGNPPTYTQDTIANLTRALTGWSIQWQHPTPYYVPMTAEEYLHDKDAKVLLSYPGAVYTNLPAGQSAALDLEQSLANIARHPNVGPFFCKFLIQHLVTSNPTESYVESVVNVFNTNRQGARGDMKTVINAILTHPEAIAGGDNGSTLVKADFGHLREPLLWIPGLLRAVNANSAPFTNDNYMLFWLGLKFNQQVFYPPSVFNFYSPFYRIPNSGTPTAPQPLLGPEFQIHSPATAYTRIRAITDLFSGGSDIWGPVTVSNNKVTLGYGVIDFDLTPYVNQPDTDSLVEAFNCTLTRGAMPEDLKSRIKTAINNFSSSDPLLRAQLAMYLITTSSYFQVMH